MGKYAKIMWINTEKLWINVRPLNFKRFRGLLIKRFTSYPQPANNWEI